jgi:hypothetical protein
MDRTAEIAARSTGQSQMKAATDSCVRSRGCRLVRRNACGQA